MPTIRQSWLPEILFGLISVVICAALLVNVGQLERPRAAIFPGAVLWGLLIASAAITARGVWQAWRSTARAEAGHIADLIMPALIIAIGGFLLAAVGFYYTAPILIFAFHGLHAHRSGRSAWSAEALQRGVLLALGATAVMYLVFDVLIGLPAPSGTLF